ncbi:glycosyltransferase [uncultured Winogradskyella sp.]|uniref:glycosyltransferase n=1 Tax=uncultured Winogradskyella sp. TaxID=395353 RepID=UPI00260F3B07|nr:glycosyltransferase [uncultured Winogradskyella sp.]
MGHATRCIPIINALIEHNFEPIIASDGIALQLLQKEFPKLESFELPSYNITYSKKPKHLKLKLLKDTPHLLKTAKKEQKAIANFVKSNAISGIISDNRFGVRHNDVPSVFISHQLQVLSGNTTWFSTKIHQRIISKFDECWIPDYADKNNLSGILGHVKNFGVPLKYLGALSRFKKETLKTKYQLLVMLSGPEPQRTFLEEKLFGELKTYNGNICFIKGVIESQQTITQHKNMMIYNYMTSAELETTINESEMVLSRSGYTTIMDLTKLEKKAFFIPTPGQYEQEYLAKKLESEGIAPFCKQNDFTLDLLSQVENYKGMIFKESQLNYKKLFGLF